MPGTPFSTFAPKLFAIEGLTLAANKGLYFTSASTPATYDLTAFGRSVGGLADAAAGRTLFGLGDFTPGAWVSWVPTVTATTPAGSGAVYAVASAKYAKIGRTVALTLQLTVTNLGTGPAASGNITVTLPFTAAASASGYGTENAVTGSMVQGNVSQGSNLLTVKMYNNAATAVLNYQLRVSMTFESTT